MEALADGMNRMSKNRVNSGKGKPAPTSRLATNITGASDITSAISDALTARGHPDSTFRLVRRRDHLDSQQAC